LYTFADELVPAAACAIFAAASDGDGVIAGYCMNIKKENYK
jgi:hypothetical protein